MNEDYDGDIYTSKHFVYGTLIVTCWREFIRIKEEEQRILEAEPDVHISLQHDSQRLSQGQSNLRSTRAIRTQHAVDKER